jgi:tRNA dimethylallyltransferase
VSAPIPWRDLEPEEGALWVIVGPTASGKSELAMRLAERWGGEIVSADSVQVYRHFDLGSGKPTASERARAPHHLIDVREPDDPLDAATFTTLADEAIAAVRTRGARPIVCGGTFLWVKALVQGLAEGAPADPAVRERHRAIADAEGRPALHARLAEVDPESAEALAPNDLVRVSRALEVFEVTGKRQSEWHREHRFAETRLPHRLLRVALAPGELDARIRARAAAWLEAGWVDEVRDLLARGFSETRAMSSVGYREVRDHVEGRLSAEALLDRVVQKTRIFARRQRTWLRDLAIPEIAL